jgi:hypothetical protein
VPETVVQGTILIRGDALLPRSMDVASQPYTKSWSCIALLDRSTLDRQIKDAGWNFFYLAGELKGSAFGSDENATKRALGRIIAGLEPDKYNCLEITCAKTSRFLWLSYVTVTAHSRHIQESNRLLRPRWSSKSGPTKRSA